MLLTISEQPVNTLEEMGIAEVSIARTTLGDVSRDIQSLGWHFNTNRRVTLLPTRHRKEIVLPANCLRADAVGGSAGTDVVQRGLRLYNKDKNTYQFDGPVVVDMVVFLPFDELIQPARSFILIKAARIFQQKLAGSQVIEQFTEKEEYAARAILEQAELENADYNILWHNSASRYPLARDYYI